MKKYYIIYKYNKNNNDIENINDFTSLKDASNFLQIDYTNVNKYIIKNIDMIKDNNKSLKDNKYFIYKEIEED